ncbi:MAG TPA: hypothetical protein VGN32_07925, partial [Ktedonobacterales bacterium]|nr:hypothetical protein [Ktedonobacterales bacterium]
CIGCLSSPRFPTAFSLLKPGQLVGGLVEGPDGTMWFTGSDNGRNFMGQITMSGTITTYPLPNSMLPSQPVVGPDKALWFINANSPAPIGGKQLVRFQILG